MFKIEPIFDYAFPSDSLSKHAEQIQKLLKKIIPPEISAEGPDAFLKWAHHALPIFKWSECKTLPDSISITLFCFPCKGVRIENFFVDMIKYWLLPDKEVGMLSFHHMYFRLSALPSSTFFFAELKVLVEDARDLQSIYSNIPNLAQEISLGATSAGHANYILSGKTLPYNLKVGLVHQELNKLIKRFPNHIDALILEKMSHFLANSEKEFLNQRHVKHIARIICYMHIIHKNLFRSISYSPQMRHLELKFMPAEVVFPFCSKSVLGLIVGVNLMDKYESFEEEHILLAIQKFIPSAQLVKGGSYSHSMGKDKIRLIYVELEKEDGSNFSSAEISMLKQQAKEAFKYRIEKLMPAIFMIRNEEEVLRNILTLSQEIHYTHDLPQVMISIEEQKSTEVIFTVILVSVCKQSEKQFQKYFENSLRSFVFVSDRTQTVGYLKKKYPIEAQVFRLHIPKSASLLRADSSLNFYLARKEVTAILNEAIGEFRDYNGGIILKQGEVLAQFKHTFGNLDENIPDILENFFYSISPIETQATISQTSLTEWFEVFLELFRKKLQKRSSYFTKSVRKDGKTFIGIYAGDLSFKKAVQSSLESLDYQIKDVISCELDVQGSFFIGYIFEHETARGHNKLVQSIECALEKWHQGIDSLQVLQLSLQFPLISLDPRIAGDEFSGSLLRLLFEGLMRINREGLVEKGIAESFEISEDQKRYTFKMRSAFWTNGTKVLAYDFEYAWKKILSPGFKTPFSYLFYPIKNAKEAKQGLVPTEAVGVKALDDLTLQVDLAFPAPYFLELTAHTQYFPVNHQIDVVQPNWSLQSQESYVCNGAFSLRMNNPSQGYELVKNPGYWDASRIFVDEMIVSVMSPYQSYQMFGRGKLDLIGTPFGPWDSRYQAKEDDKIIRSPEIGAYWYVFNTNRFPFNNSKLRRAFSLALDRQTLFPASVYELEPAMSPLLTCHSQKSDLSLKKGDIKKAQRLFKEALTELGLSAESFPSFTLIYVQGAFRDEAALQVQKAWKEVLGVHCRLEAYDWNLVFSKMIKGDFEMGGILWRPLINDPMYTLNSFRYKNESINFAKWEKKEYQELLDQADNEIDLKKRDAFLAKAEDLLMQEVPVLPAFYTDFRTLIKKNINLEYSKPIGFLDLKWISLNDRKKI